MSSDNLTWQIGKIDFQTRCALLKQAPVTLWFTGLSGSGKSTIAYSLEHLLINSGKAAFVLDGDNVRQGLNKDLDFSHAGRSENIRRIAEVAKLMNDAGLIVITAFISPYIADRQLAKNIIGQDNFFEVHIATSQKTCEERDPKGLYKRARAGHIAEFTGISAPYEVPENPACRLDTQNRTVESCTNELINLVTKRINLLGVKITPGDTNAA